MSYSPESILQALDKSAAEFGFPGFNNMNFYLGTARLSGFRDQTRWALLFEMVVWWPAADGIASYLFAYGNCLDRKALGFPGQADWDQGMVYLPTSPIVTQFDEQGEVSYDGISIRGQVVTLAPEDVAPQPAVPERGFAIMVHLLAKYREQLLGTADELARCVPDGLPLILQLDNWHHPDVYLGEMPSQNDSLRSVAEVLASGDVSCLRSSESPNVDWRLWMSR